MNFSKSCRLTGIRLFTITILLCSSTAIPAQERIHFLVPGGAGGGWDSTARGIGDAMSRSGLIRTSSYENMSGGGGSRAIAHLIETASRQDNTLLINSTPIIIRSLQGVFEQTFRDLTPVASVIVDYGAFVVAKDSKYQSWNEVLADFDRNPRKINIAGGSSRGSMDHLVAALAFKQSGRDPKKVKYIPYNAGGHAMVGLLSGECQLLSTGLSEAIALEQQGEVRILAMTAQERLPEIPNVKTLVEQGVDATFLNWRGLFAAPGITNERKTHFSDLINNLYDTSEWEEIRKLRGWTNYFLAGDEFTIFLEQQEKEMHQLLSQLGMLSQ